MGEILDVVVDIREYSPNYGNVYRFILTSIIGINCIYQKGLHMGTLCYLQVLLCYISVIIFIIRLLKAL